MKRFLFYTTIILLVAISCQKEAIELKKSSLNEPAENTEVRLIEAEFDMNDYNRILTENELRLSQITDLENRECMSIVTVPDDFATIQEAIDAACDYAEINVNVGEYDETLTIYKPGLIITAIGEVTLNGRITLTSEANDVQIQKFNIVSPPDNWPAIFAAEVTGGSIKQITITGEGSGGIMYWISNGVHISNNHISETGWGIFFGGWEGSPSNNNIISNNTVTGITKGSCIGLQGYCNNNKIFNNNVSDNVNNSNAGIMLMNYCNNNTVRNNIVNNNHSDGFGATYGSNNIIGPNNTFNANTAWGIRLYRCSSSKFFKNTAIENALCDLVDKQGTDNTYKNNIFGCIEIVE